MAKINLMKLQSILEFYPDETFLSMDGMDDAIIGVDYNSFKLIYSKRIIINCLIKDGMNEMEAIEFFDFNIGSAYVGEKTPIICDDEMF